jgi:hypothetical protein
MTLDSTDNTVPLPQLKLSAVETIINHRKSFEKKYTDIYMYKERWHKEYK